MKDSIIGPILPVSFEDIGRAIWQIRYNARCEGAPLLVLNSKIPNIESISEIDPQFFMFVYPYALREIFRYMFYFSVIGSVDDPLADWQKDWIEFGKAILDGEDPPQSDPEEFDNYEDFHVWIEDAIEKFSNSRGEWDKYIEQSRA